MGIFRASSIQRMATKEIPSNIKKYEAFFKIKLVSSVVFHSYLVASSTALGATKYTRITRTKKNLGLPQSILLDDIMKIFENKMKQEINNTPNHTLLNTNRLLKPILLLYDREGNIDKWTDLFDIIKNMGDNRSVKEVIVLVDRLSAYIDKYKEYWKYLTNLPILQFVEYKKGRRPNIIGMSRHYYQFMKSGKESLSLRFQNIYNIKFIITDKTDIATLPGANLIVPEQKRNVNEEDDGTQYLVEIFEIVDVVAEAFRNNKKHEGMMVVYHSNKKICDIMNVLFVETFGFSPSLADARFNFILASMYEAPSPLVSDYLRTVQNTSDIVGGRERYFQFRKSEVETTNGESRISILIENVKKEALIKSNWDIVKTRIRTTCTNIINNPENERFRQLKLDNPKVKEFISTPNQFNLMTSAGWVVDRNDKNLLK